MQMTVQAQALTFRTILIIRLLTFQGLSNICDFSQDPNECNATGAEKSAVNELREWHAILGDKRRAEDPEEFRKYLNKYPDGLYATEAKERISELAKDLDARNAAKEKHKQPRTFAIMHLHAMGPRGGELEVSPGRLSWREGSKHADNFNVPCSSIKIKRRTLLSTLADNNWSAKGVFIIGLAHKAYHFRASDDGEAYTIVHWISDACKEAGTQ